MHRLVHCSASLPVVEPPYLVAYLGARAAGTCIAGMFSCVGQTPCRALLCHYFERVTLINWAENV